MTVTWARRRAAAVIAVVALLGGCAHSTASPTGSEESASAVPLSELEPLADPRAYEGPSTARLPSPDVTPVSTSPTQDLPTTVVSHDAGGDVDMLVTDTSRVVALNLSGSIATSVWALGFGETLVGRDVSTTIPGAKDLPIVTKDGHSVSAESVLAVEPTVVITDGSIGPRDVVEQLRDAGVTVVFVENDPSFDGAIGLIEEIAAIYGAPAAGKSLAKRVSKQISETHTQVERLVPENPKDRLRMIFLYVRGGAGVYYLFGEESGADDLIEGLGGIDVAARLGWRGMRPMTDEAIVAADPDLILVMTDGLASAGGVDGLLEAKPALALTRAGQNRRVVDMADADILSFGPRSAEILAALARAVYAPDQS